MPRFPWAAIGLTTTALNVLLAPMAAFADSSPTSVHVVQPGDTLLQIAVDAGTDTDTIVALNGLSNADVLSVGESIKVPAHAVVAAAAAAPTPTSAPSAASKAGSYTVASGDNLWDIAQRFGTTPDAIVQVNHLEDADHLSLGTVLSIPGGGSGATSSAPSGSGTSAASSPSGASSGSSASSGAGTGTTLVAAAATLVASSISSPSKPSVTVSYTVEPGETLMQIANRFDVQADTIVHATNLSDADKIGVGSVLKVPVPARTHVVADGETLRDIAASEKVDLGALIDFNHIDDPALIRVGQVVLVPPADAKQAVGAVTGGSTAASPKPSATATPAAAATPSPSPTSAPARPTASPTPAATQAPASTTSVTPSQSRVTAQTTAGGSPTPTPSPASSPSTSSASTSARAGTSGSASNPASATAPAASATPAPRPAVPVPGIAGLAGASSDGLAAAALKLVGLPYLWGGSTTSGFDCSGLVWYVARELNKPVSRSMQGQYDGGAHPSRDQLKPGDLVFFQNTWTPGLSHNGVYIGGDRFVNAANESTGVTISNLNSAYWSPRWYGATRLP